MGSKRVLQISQDVREVIAQLFAQGRVSDPRLQNVTIQRVIVTPDLSLAKVYFTILGVAADQEKAMQAFKKSVPFFKKHVNQVLQLRMALNIAFFFDDTIQHAAHMSQLLKKVRDEREEKMEIDASTSADVATDKDNG